MKLIPQNRWFFRFSLISSKSKYIVVDGYCQNFSRIGLVVLFWPRVEAVVSADFRLPPWQRTGSHLRRRHGQIGRIRLRTAAPSTVFSRFGPVRLLFVSKLEKVTRRAKIWVEWGGYRRHGAILCRSPENVFFRRVKEVGASLGQVYRAKRRLCWEINHHFSKIFVPLLLAKYLSDRPRNIWRPNL